MTGDDEFLAELRTAAERFDPVPAGVMRDASAALALRSLDAEIAELLENEAVAVRGDDRPLLLAFESERITVNLEISGDVVRGLVTGAVGEVVVETPHSRRSAPITDGWFTVMDVPSGLVRVRLTAADGTSVITQWARF